MRGAWPTIAGALFVLAASPPGLAEDRPYDEPTWWGATQLKRQWTRGVPRSPALDVPLPVTRDEQVQPVTLREAITFALENNPQIAAQRLEPFRLDTGVLGAQALFDPTFSGEVAQEHLRVPNASALVGSTSLRTDDRYANFHLVKTFRTGTVASVDFLNERLDQNAQFQQLRPEYTPAFNLSIAQPLLRGFGWDFSYLVVRVAQEGADAAYYTYEAQLANFVTLVIAAYWNVVRARDQLAVQEESFALATRTVEENEARVKVGLLAPVSVLEAQAEAKSREENVLIAENDLVNARQTLAQLCYYRPDATFVPRSLEPVESADAEQVEVNLERTLDAAVADRPEVHASAHGVTGRQLEEKIAGNSLLPRFDLVGSYGVNGLSGTNVPIGFQDRGCIPNPDQAGTFLCPSPFAGPRSNAYETLESGEFRSYSFGFQFQVPLSNAAARSQYAQSRIARDQAELNHRELLSQVTLEVRRTVSDVLTARQRITTSRVAVELAAENLRNQEKRHEVGIATTKDLLDFQTNLTSARAAEVSAKIDYALAVARWRRAHGALLRNYQVLVEQPGKHSVPWFARF